MSDPAPATAPAAAATRSVDGVDLPAVGTYGLDPTHTHVGFVVRHMMVSKVRGRFTKFDGKVVIAENPTDSTTEVTIDAASIDTREETRDADLRSANFFDVENHPSIAYTSTKVSPSGDEWVVDGDLTIRGVTRSVPLTVTFEGGANDPWGNARIGFSATAEIDREDFGLTWNVALEAGGFMVGKSIKIEIEAELVKQA
jgi:polyisoprenoid-binding protein YceI